MLNKKFIVGMMLIVGLALSSSLMAATIYVNYDSGNDTSGDGSSGSPYKTFNKGYTEAGSGDTIDLTGTFDWTNDDETGASEVTGYSLEKNLTIQGQGEDVTFIQADDSQDTADRRVFTIPSWDQIILIKDVTIRHGHPVSGSASYETQCGGGIYNHCNDFTMINCTITDCKLTGSDSYSWGGGIYNNGDDITLTNCTITENDATGRGGGLYDKNSNSIPISALSNCTISNNTSSEGFGGGIVYDRDSPQLTNCTISGNTADDYGGGIYNYCSNTIITSCTITGNSANLGGGIYNSGKWDSCSPNISKSIISGNTASSKGGGVYNYAYQYEGISAPTLTNCIISGNTAQNGGGVYNYVWGEGTNLNPSFINCSISGNSASSNGGGMYSYPFSGNATISLKNCIMWDDAATTSGNEIYNNGTSPTFSYCDIEGCGGSGSKSWNADFGTDGGNNIDSDPLFVISVPCPAPDTGGDLHLQNGSPCLSTATSSGAPSDDLEGRSRPLGSGYDMGCYEEYDDGTLPVTLSIFTIHNILNIPTLYWETQSEIDNLGWNIYRNTEEEFSSSKILTKDMISGNGTTTEPNYYNYSDNDDLMIGQTYYYWLESIDYGGISQIYNKAVHITISDPSVSPQNIEKPIIYDFKNVPNPISVNTNFRFTLDKASLSSVSIYNIKGELVRILPAIMTQPDETATMFWNGKDENGIEVRPGVYFYTLIVNGKTEKTSKLIIVK